MLGDSYTPQEVAINAFRRVIELDPSFGPAYEHLIPDAFAREDTAEAARLISQLRRIDARNDWVIGAQLAFALAFGSPTERASARVALDTASTSVLQRAHFNNDYTCCANSPALWQLELLVTQARSTPRHGAVQRRTALNTMALTYMSRGRFQKADSILASIPPEQLRRGELGAILTSRVGIASDSSVIHRVKHAAIQNHIRPMYLPYAEAMHALSAGNMRAAAAGIRALEMVDSATTGALAHALHARIAGETQRSAQLLEQALKNNPGSLMAFQLRYDLGKLWLEAGDLKRANEYFSSIEMRESRVLNAPTEFYLGQVHERMGDHDAARLHYARFVDWWRDCDPAVRPFWEEGRKALVRLQLSPGHR